MYRFVIPFDALANRLYHTPAFDQWTAENYSRFLFSSQLLVRDGDQYRITHLGVDFLEWMVKVGAPEKKGL